MSDSKYPLLVVEKLCVSSRRRGAKPTEVVRGVSFQIDRGESLALVGESGSGKTATALSLARLLPQPPCKITGGKVLLDGEDVLHMGGGKLRRLRGARIAYVFQDPASALNPVFTIRHQMAEILKMHRPEISSEKRVDEIVRWLYRVGVIKPEKCLREYPHQLGSGMKQRVMTAMALACQPDLLIADEPTASLDVTMASLTLSLFREIGEETGMALLLLTHDFGVVRGAADRVAVMSEGKIVEQGETETLLSEPSSQAARDLLNAVPQIQLPAADEAEELAENDSDTDPA